MIGCRVWGVELRGMLRKLEEKEGARMSGVV